MNGEKVRIRNQSLVLSNLDKVLYPETGYTKAHILEYYQAVSPWLLPHLRLRPLTLKRYPDGVGGEYFYEKRCPAHRPDWMPTAEVEHGRGKTINYCVINDLAGLMWVANTASLELHVLLSRRMAPSRPTFVVFDLDPGPPAGLIDAADIGLMLRRVLAGVGMESYAKVSGGKGLHVYAPLNTPYDFDQTKDFARTVAGRIESHYPERVTSKMRKEHRKGKVFIDWSQNDEHKTTVCVYSLRAAEPVRVSAPVSWDEVKAAVDSGREEGLRFTPDEVRSRLAGKGDLFAGVLTVRQRLPGLKQRKIEPAKIWRAEKEEGRDNGSLAEYRGKRDLKKTPEPPGGSAAEELKGTFVIQRHSARTGHYDLRLECGGVLKSWAVPKGLGLDPDEKHLAVRVEDHPLEYARFEGRIPKGQYGAGRVIVWDLGKYELPGRPEDRDKAVEKALEEGKLEFILHGIKLQGRFVLVRTGRSEKGKADWLLMKKKDQAAQKSPDPRETDPYSVVSGLWIEDLA